MSVLIVRPGVNLESFEFSPFFAAPFYNFFSFQSDFTPLRSLSLTTYLTKNNFNCNTLDLFTCLPFRKEKLFSNIIKKNDYKFVVFSVDFREYPLATKLADICKRINPNIKTIFEGPPATFFYHNILQSSDADYTLIGEGELPLLDLVSGVEDSKILGLAYKTNEKIIKNPKAPPINLNLLSPLIWEKCKPVHFNYRRYLIETSRGCPIKCSFCVQSRMFNKVRFKNTKKVGEELEELDGKDVMIYDLNFGISESHTKKICKEIQKRNLRFSHLWARASVHFLDRRMLKMLKETGFDAIDIGIESLTPESLKTIKKTKYPSQHIKKCLKLLNYAHNLGLNVEGGYIIPLPGQTENKIIKEIKILKKYSDLTVFLLTPYPGTPEWKRLKTKLITQDFSLFDAYHLVIQSKFSRKFFKKIDNLTYPPHQKIKRITRMLTSWRFLNVCK